MERDKWSSREVQVLYDKFEKVSWTELKSLFPNRSKAAMFKKARSLGLNRAGFKTTEGGSFNYYRCENHGLFLPQEVRSIDGILYCPRCDSRVRIGPRRSKYKGLRRIRIV
jgi:hypothetical protein